MNPVHGELVSLFVSVFVFMVGLMCAVTVRRPTGRVTEWLLIVLWGLMAGAATCFLLTGIWLVNYLVPA